MQRHRFCGPAGEEVKLCPLVPRRTTLVATNRVSECPGIISVVIQTTLKLCYSPSDFQHELIQTGRDGGGPDIFRLHGLKRRLLLGGGDLKTWLDMYELGLK